MNIVPMEVTCIDSMGSDLSVVTAARVSFDKESELEYYYMDEKDESDDIPSMRLSKADTKLIAYLAEHNHWSPFSHAFLSFRIKAPIFVARQLQKHTVGLAWNEVSRRYVDSEPEFYFPEVWRGKAENVKQGSSNESVYGSFIQVGYTDEDGDQYAINEKELTALCLAMYDSKILLGCCAEQARMVLPQNTMTEWIWSGSLYAFARVCNLRLDSHTQKETRDVASQLSDLIKPLFPVSWEALVK